MHRLGTTLIGIGLAVTASAVAQTRYLSDMPDVPLPPAFTEIADAALVFDKPEGRVVRASARAPADVDSGRGFYRETLPELGWRLVSDGADADIYERGTERLTLLFVLRPDGRRIDFSAAPGV